jgi:CubicO group peptidase (beta-lactamase class C family)
MFAQGFHSTTADYASFLAMVMDGVVVDGKQLLSKAAIARMLTPVSKTTMNRMEAVIESLVSRPPDRRVSVRPSSQAYTGDRSQAELPVESPITVP